GDSGVVTLALPEILRDFGAEVGEVAWVLIAFNLVLALVAVPAARVCVRGDPAAATTVGLIVFATATIGCAVAPSLGVLIAARATGRRWRQSPSRRCRWRVWRLAPCSGACAPGPGRRRSPGRC